MQSLGILRGLGGRGNAQRANATPAVEQVQYLTFEMGTETYGVGILSVREIIEYEAPLSVPGLPSLVSGIINLRGVAVPVVELAACLGRMSSELSKRTCILIIETLINGQAKDVGFIVDAVDEVLDIRLTDIDPPTVIGNDAAHPYLIGTAKVDGGFVILLDFRKLVEMYAGSF